MLESDFQGKLIKEIKKRFRGCVVLKNDSSYIQGIPDIIILYDAKWAALECKRGRDSRIQPNQEYYVMKLNNMSFAAFICPENKGEVLDDLQYTFEARNETCVS